MSFAEIRDEVAKLSREERLDLQAYLMVLAHQEDPEYLAELDRRMERMDRGEKVTAAEFEAMHQKLIAEGRGISATPTPPTYRCWNLPSFCQSATATDCRGLLRNLPAIHFTRQNLNPSDPADCEYM